MHVLLAGQYLCPFYYGHSAVKKNYITYSPVNVPILWMEEILHQLVYGLSTYNPIIYSVS